MAVSLFGQNAKMHFWSNWHWNQWLGGFVLIILGCSNLIWPLPTLILLVVLIVLLCFLISPYVALVITTLLLGFEGTSIGYSSVEYSYGYGIFYYMGTMGLLCWCLARLAGVTQPYQSTTLDLPLAIFVVSGICALLWSSYWQDGLRIVFFTTMSYCIYLLISALNTTPLQVERLFWLWFVLGNITIITTVASFFFSLDQSYQLSDHIFMLIRVKQFMGTRLTLVGTMGSGAKAIACLLNISIFCALTLLCTRIRRSSRLLIFVSLLGMLIIHFMTLSRLETMGLFFGWLTFAYLNPQWRDARIFRHLLMAASVVTVIVAVIIIYGTFYNLNELFARALSQEQTVGYRFSSAQGRYDHVYYALTAIWASAGLGGGSGGIMRGMDPSSWIHSPSLYFSFLTEHGYGMLSLIFVPWIIINVITELRWALRNCPDPRYKIFVIGACSGLVTYATAGIGDHMFFIYEMWVYLGFGVAAVKGVRYLVKSS